VRRSKHPVPWRAMKMLVGDGKWVVVDADNHPIVRGLTEEQARAFADVPSYVVGLAIHNLIDEALKKLEVSK
jgi:hypothetical protein